MKILIDMNLSPSWTNFLISEGHQAIHWSTVGKATDADVTLLRWADKEGFIVLTQDLDFGVLLAGSHAASPSVVQIRSGRLSPDTIGSRVHEALMSLEDELGSSCYLVTLDLAKTRVSLLPLR